MLLFRARGVWQGPQNERFEHFARRMNAARLSIPRDVEWQCLRVSEDRPAIYLQVKHGNTEMYHLVDNENDTVLSAIIYITTKFAPMWWPDFINLSGEYDG